MTRRELDVPHAHPGGIGERGDQEEAAGAGGGDQVLDERVGLVNANTSTIATTAPDQRQTCWG